MSLVYYPRTTLRTIARTSTRRSKQLTCSTPLIIMGHFHAFNVINSILKKKPCKTHMNSAYYKNLLSTFNWTFFFFLFFGLLSDWYDRGSRGRYTATFLSNIAALRGNSSWPMKFVQWRRETCSLGSNFNWTNSSLWRKRNAVCIATTTRRSDSVI